MCFAPQLRALFLHLNFQKWLKWTEHEVFCMFWLENVLGATAACTSLTSLVFCAFWLRNVLRNFSSLIWPAGSALAALASLLIDPPEPQIIGKTQCFATFLPFRAPGSSFFWDFLFSFLFFFLLSSFFFLPSFFSSLLFSSLLFSSLLCLFSSLLFHLSMSEVWRLNFLWQYIHTLHYNTLQYMTIHSIALHYIALHYNTYKRYTTIHTYATLQYNRIQNITFHYVTITIHYIPLQYITIHTSASSEVGCFMAVRVMCPCTTSLSCKIRPGRVINHACRDRKITHAVLIPLPTGVIHPLGPAGQ